MIEIFTQFSLCSLIFIFQFLFAENTSAQTRRPSAARSLSTTNLRSSSTTSEFDCPEEFGYYPHPSDCTQYYVCVFGGALLESCTGGLMYSHELQTCDWPRNVGCQLTDNVEQSASGRDLSPRVPQIQQYTPHKFRFSSVPAHQQQQHIQQQKQQQQQLQQQQQQQQPQQQLQLQQPQQQQHILREQQSVGTVREFSIPAQIQAIPPPPELKIAPKPVITSRGQPKLSVQEDIAKVCHICIYFKYFQIQ